MYELLFAMIRSVVKALKVPVVEVAERANLLAEVDGRNRVRWSAAQLSNESALPRTTNSTP